jgi:uncharacterized protein YeaO (DUF488 family)
MAAIRLKRVYERPSTRDGLRFLVERLWPRGMKKTSLELDGWPRNVAPSSSLRQWFSHDPKRWVEFQRRYFRELAARPDAWRPLLEAARRHRVTLVYSSRDMKHNNAVALQRYLRTKLQASRPRRGAVEIAAL